MPYELNAHVEEETEYEGVSRVGGKTDLLKHFLAAGLPVMIAKGRIFPMLAGWVIMSWSLATTMWTAVLLCRTLTLARIRL